MDFGEFWGGFWEGFGRSLAFLGPLFCVFFQALLPRGLKRVQETAKRSLGLDLKGFWSGLGRVWEAKMVKISRFVVFFGYAFRDFNFDRILFDF